MCICLFPFVRALFSVRTAAHQTSTRPPDVIPRACAHISRTRYVLSRAFRKRYLLFSVVIFLVASYFFDYARLCVIQSSRRTDERARYGDEYALGFARLYSSATLKKVPRKGAAAVGWTRDV